MVDIKLFRFTCFLKSNTTINIELDCQYIWIHFQYLLLFFLCPTFLCLTYHPSSFSYVEILFSFLWLHPSPSIGLEVKYFIKCWHAYLTKYKVNQYFSLFPINTRTWEFSHWDFFGIMQFHTERSLHIKTGSNSFWCLVCLVLAFWQHSNPLSGRTENKSVTVRGNTDHWSWRGLQDYLN